MIQKLFLMVILLTNFAYSAVAQKENKGYKIGDTIMDFQLKNIDGTFKSLKDYKKEKGMVIIFTCNHCPFSVSYEDRIIMLHKKYAPKGFPIVAINPNDVKANPIDSYENMIERAQEKGFLFDYLYDETQEVAKKFGATHTPHVFIVSNHNNFFRIEYIGAIDDNSYEPQSVQRKHVEATLEELLKEVPVSITQTKALGCTIKWKK